jgi:DNA-binding MarR family transcriptional regulator
MTAHENDGEPEGVILSPGDVRDAVRLLELLTTRRTGANDESSRENLLSAARFSLDARQGRVEHFSPAMFGEPAWDLLLALYVTQADNPAPAVSNLAKTAGIAITTAFRWIDYLEEKRLIERKRSSDDGRALAVALSEDGRARLEGYFTDVLAGIIATRQEIDIQD